ncbi:MAG: cytochrome c oxidase subunit II [Myxococcota bacterium]
MKEKLPASFDLPPAMSTYATEVDWLYDFIWWWCAGLFLGIMLLVVLFVIRYRRRPGVRAEPTGHHTALELAWTFLPLILLVFLFHKGFEQYMEGIIAPADALEVRVRGMQWSWEFEHENGATETDELWVPEGEPVKLVMSSSDVLHSFFIPEFRVKRDVIPGQYTTVWFEATDQGEAQVYCAEYCGAPSGDGNAGHSNMLAKINIVSREEYETHINELGGPPGECEGADDPAACWGESLFSDKGCTACHGVDGQQDQPAPNMQGLWGRSEQLASGESVDVDENYIRESILQPQAEIVEGYTGVVMPPFQLDDKEIDALIAYIKSLSESQ